MSTPKVSKLTRTMPHKDARGGDGGRCYRCGRPLTNGTVWLELNHTNHLWVNPDVEKWPENESQGCFEFGPDCAAIVLAEKGKK